MNQPQPQWEKEFDEFVATEGCQAGSEICGQKGSEGIFHCAYCQQWGGAEGEPKYHKRPIASAGKIKDFITNLHTRWQQEARREIERMKRKLTKCHCKKMTHETDCAVNSTISDILSAKFLTNKE